MTSNDIMTAMANLSIGPFKIIASTFNCMRIAEEEIERAQAQHPKHSDAIYQSFRHLRPTALLDGVNDDLYRAHCREIIDRIVNGEDIRPATKAEVICSIKEASLMSPMTRKPNLLYQQLFIELLPEHSGLIEADPITRHDRKAMDELLVDLRSNLPSARD